jgi:signal transduction histidine kinase/CheY-like chemotaxis protein
LITKLPARHILFAPLLDGLTSKATAACVVWSSSPAHHFSIEPDLGYLVAFSSSITAELSRLATIDADQKKGDFLGSISHELRSPLHGVLASAEFLAESKCTPFETNLVETIDVCGRTLLDTINSVLEFSRINAFEKTFKKPRKSKLQQAASNKGPVPMPGILSVFQEVDVAMITEEVVEGIFAGRQHSNFTSIDLGEKSSAITSKSLSKSNVEVILDFEANSYSFVSQPGALRRIIMNIFTNSLKFTENGIILVKLQLKDLDRSSDFERKQGKMLTLSVKDTGKGMSPSYLRTRIFTPFAQENSLSPGTGLGLSIVKSIVSMLNGSIDIVSALGRGTEVMVKIPLLFSSPDGARSPDSSSTSSFIRAKDDSIQKLQSLDQKISIGLYGFSQNGNKNAKSVLRRTLEGYIKDWYGLEYVSSFDKTNLPSIIITEEEDFKSLADWLPNQEGLQIITLCNGLSQQPPSLSAFAGKTTFLSKPFGPNKLARSLRKVMESREVHEQTLSSRIPLSPPPASPVNFSSNDPISTLPSTQDQNNPIAAHSGSENAQMAFTPAQKYEDALEFPFYPVNENSQDQPPTPPPKPMSPKPRRGNTDSILEVTNIQPARDPIVPISEYGEEATQPSITTPAPNLTLPLRDLSTQKSPFGKTQLVGKHLPRVLLVEDNAINLMLLETFMKKRAYTDVDKANNGQVAVDAARAKPYDIIFMDISMPVKNGFEATREIRDIEAVRAAKIDAVKHTGSVGKENISTALGEAPALIIALTGLASSSDQREAIQSGVDLFMTKPVSFKDVGKLLDNWELNAASANASPGVLNMGMGVSTDKEGT